MKNEKITEEQRAFTVARMDEEQLAFFNSCNEQEQLGIALLWNLRSCVPLEAEKAQKQLQELGFWFQSTDIGWVNTKTKVGQYLERFLS